MDQGESLLAESDARGKVSTIRDLPWLIGWAIRTEVWGLRGRKHYK